MQPANDVNKIVSRVIDERYIAGNASGIFSILQAS